MPINENIPKIIEGSITMEEPNKTIDIHKGSFTLKSSAYELPIDGELKFLWIPNKCVTFSGKLKWSLGAYAILTEITEFKLILNNYEFGNCFISRLDLQGHQDVILIRGNLINKAVYCDASIDVDRIIFSIPNLRPINIGLPVKKIKKDGLNVFYSKRIILEDENYLISIDKCYDYNNRQELLKEKGGYLTQYYGELKSKKGSLNFSSSKDIFYRINTFLSFLNGRRTSAIFLQGLHSDDEIWIDYSYYLVDTFKVSKTWLPATPTYNLDALWMEYSLLFKNPNDKDFLSSAIHWYIEANNNSGFAEGSIIMAQAALELIYNWWIAEDKKLILGRDSEKIHASNKFRLLLSQLNISPIVPESFKYLKHYMENNENIQDACDAIVQIRNGIVHSQYAREKNLE